MARLYADEDVSLRVVERLRELGHDVLTAVEAGQANQRIPDSFVVSYAASLGRAVLTHNRRHFAREHDKNSNHQGIVAPTRDDAEVEALALRIHAALTDTPELAGQFLRVNRSDRSA